MQSVHPPVHGVHVKLAAKKNPFIQLVHCLMLIVEHDLQLEPASHSKHSPSLKLYYRGHVRQLLFVLQARSGMQVDPFSLKPSMQLRQRVELVNEHDRQGA